MTVITIYGSSTSDSIVPGSGAYASDDANANYAIYGEGNDTSTALLQDPTGNDVITVGNGNNQLYDGIGNSSITAGNGNNYMIVGGGNNHLTAGNGMNSIFGGAGNDTITAGTGYNQINGGNGGSLITTNDAAASAGTISNYIYGGLGNDTIHVGNGNDVIFSNLPIGQSNSGVAWHANTAPNVVTAGNGNNQIATGEGGSNVTVGNGSNYIVGGGGNDNVTVGGSATALNVVLGYGGNDSITATGTQNGSYFNGGTGNDTITTATGNSAMDGGGGNDSLHGGNGNDTMYGNIGSSTMVGGSGGTDLFYTYYADTTNGSGVHVTYTGTGAGTVTKPVADGGTDQFTNINYIVGSNGNDTLDATKNTVGTYLDGQAGHDLLIGGSGNDTLLASTGTDTISITGSGSDLIDGGSTGKSILSYANYTGGGVNLILGAADTGAVTKTGGTTDHFAHLSNITTDANATVSGASGGGFNITSGGKNLFYAGQYTAGATAGDILNSGGSDTLNYTDATGNIAVDLNHGDAILSNNITETLNNFQNNTSVVTGVGNDTVYGGSTGLNITVGAGANLIMLNGATGTGDTVNATAGTGIDTINTGAGSNSISTNGHSLVYFTDVNAGKDTLSDGSGGQDTIGFTYVPGTDAVNVSLTNTSGNGTVNGLHDISFTNASGIAEINLTQHGNDSVTLAGTHSYFITGGGTGSDVFTASANSGNDSLYGDSGNDTITTGSGSSIVDGQLGSNVIISNGTDTIYSGTGGSNNITATSSSHATVSYGFDTTAGVNLTITDTGGAATIGSNHDTITGNPAYTMSSLNDSITLSGTHNVSIDGQAGNDSITALSSSGTDTLDGGIGSDTLVGGSGTDYFMDDASGHYSATGGTGTNFFEGGANDVITGNTSAYQNILDLRNVGSASTVTLNGASGSASGGISGTTLSNFSGGTLNSNAIITSHVGGDNINITNALNTTVYVAGPNDVITAGSVDFAYATAAVNVTANESMGAQSSANNLTLNNGVVYLEGSAFNDTLSGTGNNSSSGLYFMPGSGAHSTINGLGVTATTTGEPNGAGGNFVSFDNPVSASVIGSATSAVNANLATGTYSANGGSEGGIINGINTFYGVYGSAGGNDTLTLGTGNIEAVNYWSGGNTFSAGTGPGIKYLYGGGPNDTFNLDPNASQNIVSYTDVTLPSAPAGIFAQTGNDLVNNFVHTVDQIAFSASVVPNFSALSFTVSGANTIIHIAGYSGHTITVADDTNMQASDFMFV